jgi:hypothetical protein
MEQVIYETRKANCDNKLLTATNDVLFKVVLAAIKYYGEEMETPFPDDEWQSYDNYTSDNPETMGKKLFSTEVKQEVDATDDDGNVLYSKRKDKEGNFLPKKKKVSYDPPRYEDLPKKLKKPVTFDAGVKSLILTMFSHVLDEISVSYEDLSGLGEVSAMKDCVITVNQGRKCRVFEFLCDLDSNPDTNTNHEVIVPGDVDYALKSKFGEAIVKVCKIQPLAQETARLFVSFVKGFAVHVTNSIWCHARVSTTKPEDGSAPQTYFNASGKTITKNFLKEYFMNVMFSSVPGVRRQSMAFFGALLSFDEYSKRMETEEKANNSTDSAASKRSKPSKPKLSAEATNTAILDQLKTMEQRSVEQNPPTGKAVAPEPSTSKDEVEEPKKPPTPAPTHTARRAPVGGRRAPAGGRRAPPGAMRRGAPGR